MRAYMRKMALSGDVLHVDLLSVRELVSFQQRCSKWIIDFPRLFICKM